MRPGGETSGAGDDEGGSRERRRSSRWPGLGRFEEGRKGEGSVNTEAKGGEGWGGGGREGGGEGGIGIS